MAKYGINLKIDVSKIDKEHLFKGKKGTYLDATVFVEVDQVDQYGNNGMITQAWKDQQKGEGAILGNAQVFWSDQQSQPVQQPANQGGFSGQQARQAPQPAPQYDDFDDMADTIPF